MTARAASDDMDVAPPNDPIVGGEPSTIYSNMYPANAKAYRIPIAELVQNDRTPPVTDAQRLVYERGLERRNQEYEQARAEIERASVATPSSSGNPRIRGPRSWESYNLPASTEGEMEGAMQQSVGISATTRTSTASAATATIEDDEVPRGRDRTPSTVPSSSLRLRSSRSRQRQQRASHSRVASPVYIVQQQQRKRNASRSSSSSRSPRGRRQKRSSAETYNAISEEEVEKLISEMDSQLGLNVSLRSGATGGGLNQPRQLPPLNTVPIPGQAAGPGGGAWAAAAAGGGNPMVTASRYVAMMKASKKDCFLCNTHNYFIGHTNLYQTFREVMDRMNVRLTYEFDAVVMQLVEFYATFRQFSKECEVELPYMDHAKILDHFVYHTLTPEAVKHEFALQYIGLHQAVINGCMQSEIKYNAAGQVIEIVQRINPERGKFLIAINNVVKGWLNFDAIKNNVRSAALLAKNDDLLVANLGLQIAGDSNATNVLPLTQANTPMSLQFYKMLADNSGSQMTQQSKL